MKNEVHRKRCKCDSDDSLGDEVMSFEAQREDAGLGSVSDTLALEVDFSHLVGATVL
jgi:hypothetical protein